MSKIYHIDRDYSKPLEQQKRELKAKYENFEYLWTDGATGKAKIHFMADEIENNFQKSIDKLI